MKNIKLEIAVLVVALGLMPVELFSQDSIRLVHFERSAEYPDGQKAMFTFIANNLKVTKSIDGNCKEGTVYVNFCVMSDGRLSEIKIQKGLCADYNTAVKRVVSIMPRWEPAIEYGTKKRVKSYFTLPIRVHFD
jgi:hypothetical protein